jgi:hypothetical protein
LGFFEIGYYYVAQAGSELTVYPRLPLNLKSSASQILGLQACATMLGMLLTLKYYRFLGIELDLGNVKIDNIINVIIDAHHIISW